MDEIDPSDRPTADAAAALADAAPGESVTATRLTAPFVSVDAETEATRESGPTSLLDLLASDERPQHLLRGVIIDRVPRDGERRRRLASPDGSALTLVTDQAVHLVVQYRDRIDAQRLAREAVVGSTVQQAGRERRLRIETTGDRYDVYPSETPDAEITAAVASLERDDPGVDRDGDSAGVDEFDERRGPYGPSQRPDSDAESTISALERLAALYERGALTDEEFTAAKRDLLDS